MMPISVTIITRNEEKNIADCLASLHFADEIIVVDSGSTDRTADICRTNPKVRFFYQEWLGYGRQKNVAAGFATNDWILNLDADERELARSNHSGTIGYRGSCIYWFKDIEEVAFTGLKRDMFAKSVR
ncbi:MAG: glycosyltransferase family 2 protein [Desulfuromonadales bacterium]